MLRHTLTIAWVLLLAGPAIAEQATSTSGRYQISSDEDGFVRLDTKTGALTHCKKQEGIWRCEILAEERPDIDGDIQSLRDAAAALNAELSRLTERLGAIEESLGAAGSGPVMEIDPVIEDREKGPDQTSTLAERIMQRLFEMIRELKGEAPAQQI